MPQRYREQQDTPAPATGRMVDLPDRQRVKTLVRRVKIAPQTKIGAIVLMPDLKEAPNHLSTRQPRGIP